MNPLVAALVAVVANVIASVFIAGSGRSEARVATLAGAAVAVGAAGLCALPLLIEGQEVGFQLGGLALHADTLVGTLLLPLGLATGALALGLPREEELQSTLAAVSMALAGAVLALVADNVLVLVLAELLGIGAVTRALVLDRHRGGAAYMVASGLMCLGVAVVALVDGSALDTFSAHGVHPAPVAVIALAAAMTRLGVAPVHSGLTASLQGAPGPSAMLLAAPMGGVALLVRVVQPAFALEPWSTQVAAGLLALSMLAALLAVAANDLGRSTAWTVAALGGLMVSGMVEASSTSALGGELLWAALVLSEVGFVLVVAMVTRRLGPVDLRRMHGLQAAAPKLSLMFLLVVLTIAGVPGTLEFVAHDVLLSGPARSGLVGTVLAVVAIATVGFNALRLYFSVFYGPPDRSAVEMDVGGRERAAIFVLVGLVLAGGVAPSLLPLVARAAHAI